MEFTIGDYNSRWEHEPDVKIHKFHFYFNKNKNVLKHLKKHKT